MRKLGILKEDKGKNIVVLSPGNVRVLAQYYEVYVEKDAGLDLGFYNEDFVKAGAHIIEDRIGLISLSDVMVSFNSTSNFMFGSELKVIVGYYDVLSNFSTIAPFTNLNVDLFSLDLIASSEYMNPVCTLSNLPDLTYDKVVDLERINEMFMLFLIQFNMKTSQNHCLDIIENTKVLEKGKVVNRRIIEEVNRL